MLAEGAVGRGAPVDLRLLAVDLDLDPGDVGVRRLGVVVELDESALERPNTPSCSSTGDAWNAARSCTHRWAIANEPPSPGRSSARAPRRRLVGRRVGGAVDETGEIATVLVHERRLFELDGGHRDEGPPASGRCRRRRRHPSRSPTPTGRAGVPAGDLAVEAVDGRVRWKTSGTATGATAPARTEPDHDVDAAGGHRRLAHRSRAPSTRRRTTPGRRRARGGGGCGSRGRRSRAAERGAVTRRRSRAGCTPLGLGPVNHDRDPEGTADPEQRAVAPRPRIAATPLRPRWPRRAPRAS